MVVDRQAFVLGFLLRKFPEFDFNMGGFDGRLRLQKFICLLQAHDAYLEYGFSRHMRGPYCAAPAASGFALRGFYEHMPRNSKDSGFASSAVRGRLDRFAGFIRSRGKDAKFMEAVASLRFLTKARKISPDAAVRRVAFKMPDTDEACVMGMSARLEGLS